MAGLKLAVQQVVWGLWEGLQNWRSGEGLRWFGGPTASHSTGQIVRGLPAKTIQARSRRHGHLRNFMKRLRIISDAACVSERAPQSD